MTRKTVTALAGSLCLAAALGLSPLAHAADSAAATTAAGPNTLRLGLYLVQYHASANDLSGPYTPAGVNVSVQNVSTTYFAYLRDLTPHWTVELTAGIPPNTKTMGKGPAMLGAVPFNNVEVGTAKWFSPTVLMEYNFCSPQSAWRPYVGAGINHTSFYDRNSTAQGNAVNGGPTAISLSSSTGPVATAGFTYRFDSHFSFDASYSRARINSNYASDTLGVIRTTSIHFNPSSVVLAVGYSF
jgi:outer membrane protein